MNRTILGTPITSGNKPANIRNVGKVDTVEKAAGGEADYSRSIRALVRALHAREIPMIEFQGALRYAVERGLTRAWWEGADAVGISQSEATDEENTELYTTLFSETSQVSSFADAILQAQQTRAGLNSMLKRAEMWVLRYIAIRSLAMSIFGRDKKLKWVMNPLKEHCLAAGTPVLTSSGWTPIESINPGDFVETTHGLRRVLKTEQNPYFGVLYEVGGITSTSRHRFLTADGWVYAERLSDCGNTHITLPNSDHGVSTSLKVRILRPVSILLSKLPIRKRPKSCMTVPVIAVRLNDGSPDFCINDETRLNDSVRLEFDPKRFEIRKKRDFKFRGLVALNLLLAFRQFVKAILVLFWMIDPVRFRLVDRSARKHWIIGLHSCAVGIIDKFFCGLSRVRQAKHPGPIEGLLVGQSERFGSRLSSYCRIILGEEFHPIGSPQGSALASLPRNLGLTFERSAFFSREKNVSTLDGTEARKSEPLAIARIYNLCELLLANLADEIFNRVGVFLARCHDALLLLDNNVTKLALFYHDSYSMYNLEVEDVHEFIAGGIVVHNCHSCLALNGRVYRASTWRRYDLYPRKRTLECRGYRCGCSLVPTREPATPGRPPAVA